MKQKAARARSCLTELTIGTFNVSEAAVNGVYGINHIDTQLRPCAARGVVTVLDCRRPNETELPKTVQSGYHVYFSVLCGGGQKEKGRHGVGLAIKEEIIKKVGKHSIAIECISHLTARILIQPDCVAFVVAYAPTEEAAEGQKAKYVTALNSRLA